MTARSTLARQVLGLLACAGALACQTARPGPGDLLSRTGAAWTRLDTVPYKGKQDDVFFLSPSLGWYVNGAGKIYKSGDGGWHWAEKHSRPGTYFRAIGFANEQHGFAGNLGMDYFPGVTDDTPLYETHDGGDTWAPAPAVPLPKGAGVCAIDILRDPFINAGTLDHRTVIHVGGRVGGPAYLLRSLDEGQTWKLIDLNGQAAMILDVKFFDANTGLVAAGSDREVERSHALLLRTQDGGNTWTRVYESTRPFEDIWKVSFPTRAVGYATIQSYDERPGASHRYVAKTTDEGKTWHELPLADDGTQQEFGVGFVSADVGWVGATRGGYQTLDGGKTWTHLEMGRAVNKIRTVPTADGFVAFAIGADLYKLDARPPQSGAQGRSSGN
jgi:photosystem II stability/assembly factor-like uncharacterized protein